MQQILASLLAEGFNVEQMLATGVIGGGAALMIGAVTQLIQKPKPSAKGQPVPKKMNPLVAVMLTLVGLALVFVGVVWRITSQQPSNR
jgi:hypothetical protein